MAILLLIARIEPISPVSRKTGSMERKTGPKSKSRPGNSAVGTPIHGATAIRFNSIRPKNAANALPASTPMIGAHRRSTAEPFRDMPRIASIVTNVVTGAANSGLPSGAVSTISKMKGITVTGSIMITVPETAGVNMRRNSASRAEKSS